MEKVNYHFFATQLMVKGIPVQVIQKLLGHSSSTMTMIYSVVNSLTEEVVEKIGLLMEFTQKSHSLYAW